MNPIVDFYASLNKPAQESIYWFVLFSLQNPTSDLIRQVIEIRKIRRRGHGDTSTGKNDERSILLRIEKAIWKIHVSNEHTSLSYQCMISGQNK
jgi:hypothetical protein